MLFFDFYLFFDDLGSFRGPPHPLPSHRGVGGPPAASYAAPSASYAAPATRYAAPVASYATPAASYAVPAASYAAPSASYAAPVPELRKWGYQQKGFLTPHRND